VRRTHRQIASRRVGALSGGGTPAMILDMVRRAAEFKRQLDQRGSIPS
jgi:hypothetical protein